MFLHIENGSKQDNCDQKDCQYKNKLKQDYFFISPEFAENNLRIKSTHNQSTADNQIISLIISLVRIGIAFFLKIQYGVASAVLY